MRAGTLNITIETGAAWHRDIQCLTPAQPIEAQAVTPGQRIYVDGVPLRVATATPTGAGRITFTFGDGLYGDPAMTFVATALLAPAEPVLMVDAIAGFHVADPEESTVPIPTTLSPDGLTLSLVMGPAETSALYGMAGTHSWDCYTLTEEWDWRRVVEGTLVIIRGDAR